MRTPVCRLLACAGSLLGVTGCSSLAHVSAGPVVASERGEGSAGGAASAHFGLAGRWHAQDSAASAMAHYFMPVGIETMARVAVTSGFGSGALGGGYYLTGDVGRHFAFGRLDGLFTFNGSDAFRVGGGLRAEGGFGWSLGEQFVRVPGILVEEQRRERSFITVGLFGEYTGQFSRRAEMPMAGIVIGYASESVLLDLSRGQLFR